MNRGFLLGTVCLILILTQNAWTAEIYEAQGKTFIVDQRGERWEITQAMSLGFHPEGFQFGIGRSAIRPLDGQDLKTDGDNLPEATRVIGIAEEGGGSAHAYSVQRLTRHEIANTQLGEAPIAAAYCPLVDLAAVYRRQLDGRTLTLAPSGWTYDFTFVLVDKETGSLWYPDEKGLTAIQGALFGRRLPKMPSHDTNWGQWHTGHPNSHILP